MQPRRSGSGPSRPAFRSEGGSATLKAVPQPPNQERAAHADLWIGEWLSLVEHLVRDQGVGGSNPLSPTNSKL